MGEPQVHRPKDAIIGKLDSVPLEYLECIWLLYVITFAEIRNIYVYHSAG